MFAVIVLVGRREASVGQSCVQECLDDVVFLDSMVDPDVVGPRILAQLGDRHGLEVRTTSGGDCKHGKRRKNNREWYALLRYSIQYAHTFMTSYPVSGPVRGINAW